MDIDTLRAMCAQHDGVFLRREAIAHGFTDKLLASLRRQGEIHRLRQGAYTLTELWAPLDDVGRHLLLARSVLRTTPGPVALSHVSAVVSHGVPVWGVDLSRVHVTRLDTGAGRIERDVVHHTGDLPAIDVTVTATGLPVVTAGRAVLEAAASTTVEAGLVIADGALHRGLCAPDELRDRFEGLNHWPGSQRIHVVLHHADGRAESVGETRTRYLCWRHGLPTPVVQLEIRDRSGVVIAVTDLAWPDLGLLGEFDGQLKYGRFLRPGESPGDAVFREKKREDRIRELTSWRFWRLTWSDLSRPEQATRRFWHLARAA